LSRFGLVRELLFDGFGEGVARCFHAAAEEKSQMPGAALAAAEWAKEREKKDGPLQDTAPVRTQNIFASAKRAPPRTNPEQDRMCS